MRRLLPLGCDLKPFLFLPRQFRGSATGVLLEFRLPASEVCFGLLLLLLEEGSPGSDRSPIFVERLPARCKLSLQLREIALPSLVPFRNLETDTGIELRLKLLALMSEFDPRFVGDLTLDFHGNLDKLFPCNRLAAVRAPFRS